MRRRAVPHAAAWQRTTSGVNELLDLAEFFCNVCLAMADVRHATKLSNFLAQQSGAKKLLNFLACLTLA